MLLALSLALAAEAEVLSLPERVPGPGGCLVEVHIQQGVVQGTRALVCTSARLERKLPGLLEEAELSGPDGHHVLEVNRDQREPLRFRFELDSADVQAGDYAVLFEPSGEVQFRAARVREHLGPHTVLKTKHHVVPSYPARARRQGIEAECRSWSHLDIEGRVQRVEVDGHCPQVFWEGIVDAGFSSSHYPAKVDGQKRALAFPFKHSFEQEP